MSAPVNDGGPAFPYTPDRSEWVTDSMFRTPPGDVPGMTLRDYFAAKAMQGFLNKWIPASREEKDYIAQHAYAMADAMLKARGA